MNWKTILRLSVVALLLAVGTGAQEPVYFITGSVRSPGNYPLTADLTVEQAIAKAGGALIGPAGTVLTVKIQRKQGNVRLYVDAKLAEAVLVDDRIDVRYTKPAKITPKMNDVLRVGDMLEVRDRP